MDYNFSEVFHCLFIFNSQHEPIFTLYDDYITKLLIQPYQSRNLLQSYSDRDDSVQLSITNILMQLFSPILASQSGMLDSLKMKFTRIQLMDNRIFIIKKVRSCHMILLLANTCPYRQHSVIITKKLDTIEWVISCFFGLCWSYMKPSHDKWLKVILKELLFMDNHEFNINFVSVERLDLLNNKRLTEKVLDSLIANSKYLKQINMKNVKHQLILAGSKLYTLHSNDNTNSTLSQKHILLLILLCNVIFNRFSRLREINSIIKPTFNNNNTNSFHQNFPNGFLSDNENSFHFTNNNDSLSSERSMSSSDNSSIQNDKFSKHIPITNSLNKPKTGSSTITGPLHELDPFVLWVENKDGHKYRIVRIFLNFSWAYSVPCNIHLIKLTRNVIYVCVEEDVENNIMVANLDKCIRLIRKIINEQITRNDSIAVLRGHIGQAIEKLLYLNVMNSQKLRGLYKQILKEIYNTDLCERLLKELLKLLEWIYVSYYISTPIKVNDRLCKGVLKCFINVRKDMLEFMSILSVKAVRNLPLTSLYSLYPGLITFAFSVKRGDNFLVVPTIEPDAISEKELLKLDFWMEISRRLAMGSKVESKSSNSLNSFQLQAYVSSVSWRQVELVTDKYRVNYLRRVFQISNDRSIEMELVLVHESETISLVVKKQFTQLVNQFLGDLKSATTAAKGGPNLLNLTS